MLQKAPGCYVWLGQGKEHAPGDLHHEEYDFNDDIAVIGVAWFSEVSKRTLITTFESIFNQKICMICLCPILSANSAQIHLLHRATTEMHHA